jgi:ORF6N domain
MKTSNPIPIERIERAIYLVRGEKVMLDSDLAALYGVSTARLNQQVNRNLERFPEDFMFQLTNAEFKGLMLQIATSKTGRGGRRKLPLVFTEHGAIKAAAVLNSTRAVQMSVFIVRAFVKLPRSHHFRPGSVATFLTFPFQNLRLSCATHERKESETVKPHSGRAN